MTTDKCAECKHDRTGWTSGPWDNEPDRVEFEHAGLPCILHRSPAGHWCGYVGVSPVHPLHGKSYDSYEDEAEGTYSSPVDALLVHGGITYGHECVDPICHVPKPGEPEHLWWLGFDCAHSGDYSPRDFRNGDIPNGYEVYKTAAYVRRETEQLAEQLATVVIENKPRGS